MQDHDTEREPYIIMAGELLDGAEKLPQTREGIALRARIIESLELTPRGNVVAFNFTEREHAMISKVMPQDDSAPAEPEGE